VVQPVPSDKAPRPVVPNGDDPWPPHFPHADIDALLDRLERAEDVDPDSARDLLALVAQEAQRLRSTVVRLSAARLSAAEREAATIIADAQTSARALRAAALDLLDARLDEAERLTTAVREALSIERRRARAGTVPAQRTAPRRARDRSPADGADAEDADR
jgi:hypothetical protein